MATCVIQLINRNPILNHEVEGTEKWDIKVIINYPHGGLIGEFDCYATVNKHLEHFDPNQIPDSISSGVNKRGIILQIKQFLASHNDLK